MAQEHNRQTGMLARDPAVEYAKVFDTFRPAVALGEQTQFGRRSCRAAVPAVVVGINCIASAILAPPRHGRTVLHVRRAHGRSGQSPLATLPVSQR